MSDLAPFVAAAIRDRVVEDMAKEIDDLKKQKEEELAPWTVTIHGPEPPGGGEPTVYAWARISMKDVLTQTLGREDGTDQNLWVEVHEFNTTDNIIHNFLSCSVTITCNRASSTGEHADDSSYRLSFDDDAADIGTGIGIRDEEGQGENMRRVFWFHWWYSPRVRDQKKNVVAGFEVAVPIPPENQDRVTDEIVGNVDKALDFAGEVAGDNAPIRILDMTLTAQGFVSLLNGNDDSDADDDEESVNNDEGTMVVEQ